MSGIITTIDFPAKPPLNPPPVYPPDDGPGFTLAHQVYPYHHYSLVVHYSWHSGLSAQPVAYVQGTAGQQSVDLVRVSAPQGRKTVTFEMLRQGAPPEIPQPLSSSANEQLLTAEVTVSDPKLDAAGKSYLYSASGIYVYALAQPIFPTQGKWPRGAFDGGSRQTEIPVAQSGAIED